MRILHVIPWLAPRYGGPAISVPQASVRLAERGHRVEIITTNADGPGVLDVPTGRRIDWAGATATFHPISRPSRYGTSWPMLADLRRRGSTFDILHIHCLYRFHGLAAAAVARSQGVPYIIQAHGSLDPWHRHQKRRAKDLYHALIEDPIIRGASAMLCTSRREDLSIRDLGYTVPRWVIPIGIDAHELRVPGVPDVAVATSISVDARVVTFLGRISVKKGVPLLVESFRSTATAFPRAHLVIAGPDDEGIGRGLMPMIAKAGLADRVSFLGAVDGSEKRTLLQRSDVFVLASADESFGIAVAEAMAVGCPVVVSPDVAIEDVVRASGAGLVVERDPAAIANAIATILSEPVRAAAMGEAGRRAADERFSWPIVAAQAEAMYEAVVSASRRRAGRSTAVKAPTSTTGVWIGPAFRCPRCRNVLAPGASNATWNCEACGWTGSAAGGIPILLPQPAMAEHDELDHDHAHGHKAAQATHFDRPDEEVFETDRPHGTPRLYRFLLAEKFRRAVSPIGSRLVGATALTVCGGSGMDAEFLSRAGAAVTSSDLSLGAATRATARSERYGLKVQSVVADVEHLPFADGSIDLVAVHDGLHHLEDPYAGLAEMARVARRWVVVTEPAQASITRLAIRLGLALEAEEAGNRVARMEPSEVGAFLDARGYVVLRAERYAMYYPHHPGAVFRLLSRRFVFPIVRVGWRLVNALVGRFGNKMVVVAQRDQTAATASLSPSRRLPIRSATWPSDLPGPGREPTTATWNQAARLRTARPPSGERPGTILAGHPKDSPTRSWDHKQSAKEVVRHLGLKLGVGGLLLRRRREHGLVTAHLDPATAVDRFREAYASRAWVSGEGQRSLSGLGSEAPATRTIVEALPALLARLGCEKFLDVGCGDWNWMREVRLPCAYLGVDIVPEVIEANRRYERIGVEFEVCDAANGPLPATDVILCREVLFHLSFRDGMAALANIRAAGRWLLATSDTAIWFNSDIATGDFRRINLERAPYRLPRPSAVISDEGVCPGRVLALWATADLPVYRRRT